MGAVEIAATLAASRRAVRLYPPEHPSHREALRDLVNAVNEAVDIRPLVLNLKEGRLYEASEVITDRSPATRALAEALEARRVESLTFHMGFEEVDGEGVSEVLSLRSTPELQVQEELDARGVKAVTVSELEDNSSREAEERDRQREADRGLFRRALTVVERVRAALAEGAEVDSAEVTRTIAPFIQRVAEDPYAMLALAQMTGHGERWRFHAVGVMANSIVLGNLMGLSDRQQLEVGLAGLMHDIGSALLAGNDPEAVRQAHPVYGARALGPLADESCATMMVSFEHHIGVNGTGWPQVQAGYVAHPFARLVAVVDCYDNLLRGTPDTPPVRPDEAVGHILNEATNGPLDPWIARIFADAVGVMPIGCVVRLTDHSVGVIYSPAEDSLQPKIRLILDTDGTDLRPVVDLDLRESELDIVEVVPAALLGIQPSDYL